MKTQIIILAVIVLSALSVSAKSNNHNSPDLIPTNAIEFSSVVFEEPLQIESWMTDDTQWMSTNEDVLTIEPWMTDDAQWFASKKSSSIMKEVKQNNSNLIFVTIKKAKEQPLKIENWMTDDKAWTL